MSTHVIAYDVGTTGIKTCLFEISDHKIHLIASAMEAYSLFLLEDGGAEQDPEEWWQAMCSTTRQVLKESGVSEDAIRGISFCAQMQGLVLVDDQGNPVRRAMSYMDSRGGEEMKRRIMKGFKISGLNAVKLLRSIKISGAVSASAKDPVWRYNWVKTNEPEVFRKVYKWLDVKDFLLCKASGRFVMSEDSAFATLLYDTRKGKKAFSRELCHMMGVHKQHLPEICRSTDIAGTITEKAALELGLPAGVPVFAGGGDASLIGVGAGAVSEGDTHIYMGTSGWVSTVVKKQILDIKSMIASIVGADQSSFLFFAELETAGKCLEWVRDHLALDEIGMFLEKKNICDNPESIHKSLYDYMMYSIKDVPPGSGGVIFTPWLHGNRCPFEDPNARGIFFNIGLETGKTEMIHAVLEGICYHLRWQLEAMEKSAKTSRTIRLVGGGALSPLTCQILSNILNREIETVDSPQNVGAVGAAAVIAVGLGIIERIEDAKKLIPVQGRYLPQVEHTSLYDESFRVFKSLYKNNAAAFKTLNSNSR
ncbi:MAG: carbohydrate kinase [Bacillota bacterium]|jgi:xylulokinase|nr:carbohydrate kinase [Bacillota bacterium]